MTQLNRRSVLVHSANAALVLGAAGALHTNAFANTAAAPKPVRNGVLEVPGARLYYETVGSGSPLLLIPGGNGTAHIMGPIMQILGEHFTVITFDRRGFARSQLVGEQDYSRRLQTDADDALQLIKRVAGAPAAVFGPSSGAIVALQALTQGPGSINKVIAFEPPATKEMPSFAEGKQLLQLMYDTYAIYKKSGIAPAFDLFNTSMPPETVEHFKRMRDPNNPQSRAAIEYWMEHELREYTAVDFDHAKLKANAARIVMAAGTASRGFPLHSLSENLAKKIGATFVEIPGAHTGYAVRSAEFGPAILSILGAGK
ncbi:MAG: alpha/beta hydrolase [Trichocoleus desertorum ATA4-8-CV12]|jgi:pimeloyl-ACP methyl ester carboxylesterase|nr:alpha/beta hydrolase [Trichocoleus desertorum ATA4-8-CV12]